MEGGFAVDPVDDWIAVLSSDADVSAQGAIPSLCGPGFGISHRPTPLGFFFLGGPGPPLSAARLDGAAAAGEALGVPVAAVRARLRVAPCTVLNTIELLL